MYVEDRTLLPVRVGVVSFPNNSWCCVRVVCASHSVLVYREGEKITLGSFLFRDDCYNLLLKLVKVSSPVSRLDGDSSAPPAALLVPASVDERTQEDAPPEPSESAHGTAIPRALAVASGPCDDKFETMVNAILPCTTAQVLNLIGSVLVCHVFCDRFESYPCLHSVCLSTARKLC